MIIVRLLSPEPAGWFWHTNFTRASEPTLSWNQYHSSFERADVKLIERSRNLSVTAFHEKAGRSQVDSCLAWLNKIFFFPPSSHCRHASIRTLEERFVSLGACWAFSFQPVLPSVWRPVVSRKRGTWARPLTQSPELGFGLLSFLFLERF
jgi:hypothetical protein